MRKGLTLIELMITTALIAILTVVMALIFRAILISWSGQEARAGIDIGLDRGIEEMARDLREAKDVISSNDEIRFTTTSDTYYIYYLYNANDSYVPPPAFDQGTYELRRAELNDVAQDGAGGDLTTGTFTYGDGKVIISDVLPPPASDLSVDPDNPNVYIIDLTVKRKDETIRSKTQVRPRNLCGSDLVIAHATSDGVSPVNVSITYGTALYQGKCWITRNLGATTQATKVNDNTAASAGWYWQFNRKQGYAIGPTTPAWPTSQIVEDTDWISANDPCTILLGEDWRLPNYTEWNNMDNGLYYYSVLRIHYAGLLSTATGQLSNRGVYGKYWSSDQNATTSGWYKYLSVSVDQMYNGSKNAGYPVRCLKDLE